MNYYLSSNFKHLKQTKLDRDNTEKSNIDNLVGDNI
jgi:hypothetical protein